MKKRIDIMHDALIHRRIEEFHAAKLNCAETVLTTLCDVMDLDIPEKFYPKIATPFGAGFGGLQSTCGAVTGALMVIGLQRGRDVGGDKQPGYDEAKSIINWFKTLYGHIDCRALTGIDLSIPENAAAFRAPAGGHETVCEPIVESVIRELIRRYYGA